MYQPYGKQDVHFPRKWKSNLLEEKNKSQILYMQGFQTQQFTK